MYYITLYGCNTLDPAPDISLLGTTAKECSSIALSLTRFFQPQSPIPTFFVKASKHEGAVLLTAINYRSIRTAHTRQATVINQLRAALCVANTQTNMLRTALLAANTQNTHTTTTINELQAEIATLNANLRIATTSSFEATFKLNKVQHDYNIINTDNNRLLSELQVLTTPTPSISVSVQATPATFSTVVQTDPIIPRPITSTSVQTAHSTVDTASQTTPNDTATRASASASTCRESGCAG
jgi:hypothetical protein